MNPILDYIFEYPRNTNLVSWIMTAVQGVCESSAVGAGVDSSRDGEQC